MKKFYQHVTVKKQHEYYNIYLDNKPILTPLKNKFFIPSEQLAHKIADEWTQQHHNIIIESMTLTQIAMTIIDKIFPRISPVQQELQDYALNDVIFYAHAYDNDELCLQLSQQWNDVLSWGSRFFQTEPIIQKTKGVILPPVQSDLWQQKTYHYICSLDHWLLGIYYQIVHNMGSFLIATMLFEKHLETRHAHEIAEAEYYMATKKWGDDDELSHSLNKKYQDLKDLINFHQLI